jgi:Flp pilus assembly protein TadB
MAQARREEVRMTPALPPELQNLVDRYKERMQQQLNTTEAHSYAAVSREYRQFREELLPHQLSLYEKVARACGQLMKPGMKPDQRQAIADALRVSHLEIAPEDALAAAYLVPLAFIMMVVPIAMLVLGSNFLALFAIMAAGGLLFALMKYPEMCATRWRMKSSNQMVLCIFYVVTYMRHTSNLENALAFAAEHLTGPLALDLKKVIWDLETEKYDSIKTSLEAYLDTWRKWNNEFVEAFHLIESSLFEPSDERRLALLDKSLEVILDETYEKMLHYAQNLKSPITMLHMLGVILPILGLVILPLIVNFMEGVQWWHLAILYNLALPILVWYMGSNILATRPTGYGDVDITEFNPALKKYRNLIIKLGPKTELQITPAIIAGFVGAVLLIIALSPVLIHMVNPEFDITLPIKQSGLALLEYRESTKQAGLMLGPYGVGAALLSLFFPLAAAFGMGLYFRLRSKNIIKMREEAKKLEDEFASALFQLGNRLGDGLPAEIAFGRVAEVMPDTLSGQFFSIASTNISKSGMGLKDAIFNPKTGAITYFPSAVIQSSMKVLVESVKKGPLIAARALVNVSRYIKEIHKVNERLKDLLADIISDMKSQISFLSPAIAGIVVGITSMITTIIGALSSQMKNVTAGDAAAAGGQVSGLLGLFGDGIPTYYFQLVVGLYVVQIVYILTLIANGVENGADKLNERYLLGKNLIGSTMTYCFLAGVVMLIFNFIAANIIGGVALAG